MARKKKYKFTASTWEALNELARREVPYGRKATDVIIGGVPVENVGYLSDSGKVYHHLSIESLVKFGFAAKTALGAAIITELGREALKGAQEVEGNMVYSTESEGK